MLGGYKNMRSKVGPAQGLSALEPNNAKKSTFLGPIFDFLGPFLGHFGPKWPETWWEPWARVPKGPRITWAPNPKKSANLRARAFLAKNGPQKTGFWALAPNPQQKSALAII